MSTRGAEAIFFSANGAYIALDPTTGRYTLFKPDGTALVSFDSELVLAGQTVSLIVAAPAVGAGKTNAVTNFINYTPPSKAGVYKVSAMVNVTAWTTPATFHIIVGYTDSNGSAQTEAVRCERGSNGDEAVDITAVDRWYIEPHLLAIDSSGAAITLSTAGTFSGSPVYTIAAVLERVI